jgi:probable F420-dependent oxidoreductase
VKVPTILVTGPVGVGKTTMITEMSGVLRTAQKPFRFAVRAGKRLNGRTAWREFARRAEALGYSCLTVADHMDAEYAPLVALQFVASCTTSVRLGAEVLDNDFRNPLMLAKEAATLDVLSDGRLELGLGAGWQKLDYAWSGLSFDDGPTRVARLEEAIIVLKALLAGDTVTHVGRFYRLDHAECRPRPVQRPRPPLMIGGTGPRLLGLAGRTADIISFATGTPAQPPAEWTLEALARKAERVRELAAPRRPELQLHLAPDVCQVTDDRIAFLKEKATSLGFASAEDLGRSAYVLVGSINQIVEQLEETRSVTGVTYVTVHQSAMDDFAPVVARLGNQR